MLQNDNHQTTYGIKEYAVGSTTNRQHFHDTDFALTLQGNTETYQSLYLHSHQIQTYPELQRQQTGKPSLIGYKGAVAASELLLDVDRKDDLPGALVAARGIVNRFTYDFGVDPQTIKIRFSGSKGFHIILPAELFGGFTPGPALPKLQAQIVGRLCAGFEDSLDLDIYYTVSLIRVTNTINEKSGLHCIPLTVQGLNSLSIDQIKELAAFPRDVQYTSGPYKFVPSLVQVKQECEHSLTAPVMAQPSSDGILYFSADVKKIPTVLNRCKVLAEIKRKSEMNEQIGHKDRLTLGTILTAFGNEGKNKVHEMLKDQQNYDRDRTEYYMTTMAANSYKPSLCLSICGPDNLCPAIKAINRKSPIAFAYTYDKDVDTDEKKYIESYMVEKLAAHFNDVVYAKQSMGFYRYEHGVYKAQTDGDVKTRIQAFLPFYIPKELITNDRMNTLVERLEIQPQIRFEELFNTDAFRINLKNGMYDLQEGKLLPHSPDFRSTIQLPYSYDPTAQCPVFDKFMNEIMDGDAGMVEYMLNLWCYLLIPSYSFQKVWVWVGTGGNGKGTLARIMQKSLGEENVANENIHRLIKSRFSAINLKDKLVNFSSELKSADLELDFIKQLSGGDPISADIIYKGTVKFMNHARLIIMANDLPRFSELGQSVLRRFEFITFPRSFTEGDVDTKLDEKLTAELPGIFNRVVGRFQHIIRADGSIYFTTPKTVTDNNQLVLTSLNTAIEFVREKYESDATSDQLLMDMYYHYTAWCKDSGYKAWGKKNFAETLRTIGLRVEQNSKKHNSVCVIGIKRRVSG